MVAPLLFVDNVGVAGACTCYRYVGATPSQVGTSFGARWTGVTSYVQTHHGAIFYKGNLYAIAQGGVYVKDDPTTDNIADTWTQSVAFTNPTTSKPRTSGLHIVYIADAPILALVFGDLSSDNSWRWAKFDGTTWTQAASPVVSASMGELFSVIVYRQVIHMLGGGTSNPKGLTFDPAAETFSAPTDVFASTQYSSLMCVFNDRLFALYYLTGVGRMSEFSGGSWIDVPGANVGAVDSGNYVGKWALWTDGTYMYGMVPSPFNTNGWRVYQWDGTLGAPVNLTATVLPSSLISTTDGGTYGGGSIQQGVVFACGDQETDPAVGDVWLFQTISPNAGTPYSLWKWNGPAALIGNAGVANDSGGDVKNAVPDTQVPGGEYIWSAGKLDIWITGKSATAGAQRTTFRCAGAPGAANKNVKFYYDGENEPPIALATLIGVGVISGAPVGAPSLGTNEVLNVDADPTVEYYADWDLFTDGLFAGDRAQLKPVVSV